MFVHTCVSCICFPFSRPVADFNISNQRHLVDLMKTELPEYVANCLLVSGYDDLDVLCSMDVSESPQHSIIEVENYINKRYSDNSSYNPMLNHPFEFPPGHRVRIYNFIQKLKILKKDMQKSSVQKRLVPCNEKRASKRAKHDNQIDLTDDSDPPRITIATVSKQVRTNLRNWISKQTEDCFKQMTEDTNYYLRISPKEQSGFFDVSIRCGKCNVSIRLHQKDSSVCSSPYSPYNFTRHIKSCFLKEEIKCHSLLNIFRPNKNSSGSSIVPEANMSQANKPSNSSKLDSVPDKTSSAGKQSVDPGF